MEQKEGKKANRLVNEKSPYLLQHAYNPVDWFSWSDEAFEQARKEDKPIFLSIGYSTCHWCHVMERESFEDNEIAQLLNQGYISIKVDREERPDIDNLYMRVCQALTGQGGWPLTVILTPDQKPIFAGTYFPKEDYYGRSGLKTVLTRISELWRVERDRAQRNGDQILTQLETFFDPSDHGNVEESILDDAFEQFSRQYDSIYGGFGEAPKFPRPHDLLFLLRYYHANEEPEALEMVTHTLDRMRKGGIYDQIGKGFARYSVDREWLVPHFEKMLYDQALLALAYIETYQVTHEERYRNTAEEIFEYVLQNMTSSEGGFYSAEDADSEGIEGKFYVWTKQEIIEVLGQENGELFCTCFGVTKEGNFEDGTNILNQIHVVLPAIADDVGLTLEELNHHLNTWKHQLNEVREKRVHPFKDDKILTAWNGLMIAALAKGARVLESKPYLEAAEKALQMIWKHLRSPEGRLYVRYREGEAAHSGYLDDYAFVIWALIELYEATFRNEYVEYALELTREQQRLFWDENKGGFFFTGVDQANLVARSKELYDGALPSGNSVAAYNLIRLGKLVADETLLQLAERQIRAFAGTVGEAPISYSFFLLAVHFALEPTKEIVLVGDPTLKDTQVKKSFLQQVYLPDAVLSFQDVTSNQRPDWMMNMKPDSNKETALVYICENYACQQPIVELEQLQKALD